MTFKETKRLAEREYLEALARECGGNVCVMARTGGLSRPDIYPLLQRHGIKIDEYRAPGAYSGWHRGKIGREVERRAAR